MNDSIVICLIVAAGKGSRMVSHSLKKTDGTEPPEVNLQHNTAYIPKQYTLIRGMPLLEITMRKFLYHPQINAVKVVISKEDITLYERCADNLLTITQSRALAPVFGGKTRQESVYNGLEDLRDLLASKYYKQYNKIKILIHDAVRPFVSDRIISEVISQLDVYEAVDVMLPVSDTLKRILPQKHAYNEQLAPLLSIVDRKELYYTQTPQGFHYQLIYNLHKKKQEQIISLKKSSKSVSDDICLCLDAGIAVGIVKGDRSNVKLTYPEDLTYASTLNRVSGFF